MPTKASTAPQGALKEHDDNANTSSPPPSNKGKKRSHKEADATPRTVPELKDSDLAGLTTQPAPKQPTLEAKKSKAKAPADSESAADATAPPAKRAKKASADKGKKGADAADADPFDVSAIHLDGEDDETVPIYDTCGDMRIKINAHLRKTSMSQAELGRRIGAEFPEKRSISGTQIKSFLQKKGPFAGAESGVYYGAYVWFEKMRIKNGGKESKKRIEVMDAHPRGCERKDIGRMSVICFGNQRPYMDSVGRYTMM